MWCDTKCKRVRKGWNRRREWERQRARRGLNGWEHTLGCYSAGIRFHTYPRGSDRFTNGHGDNWSLQYYWNAWHQAARQTHTHTHARTHTHTHSHTHIFTYCTWKYTLWFTPHTLFMHVSSITHLSRERTKGKHTALSAYVLSGAKHTCEGSVKLSNASWLLAGFI